MNSEIGLLVADATKRILLDSSDGSTVVPESREAAARLWRAAVGIGLPDALLPEAAGGAEISRADLGELAMTIAAALSPLPLADTLVARSILAQAGMTSPDGPILLVPDFGSHDGMSAPLPLAAWARYALTETAGCLTLLELDPQDSVHGASRALRIDRPGSPIKGNHRPLLPTCAVLAAAAIAGMLSSVLEITVKYASDRTQFGKPIGAFQAVQQQLAVLAEESAAANIAARLAFAAPGSADATHAAIAKLRTGTAAEKGLAIAHAITGAIGITEEFVLQRYSRRLIDYRLTAGTEMYWAKALGWRRLENSSTGSIAFLREAAG